MSAAPTNMTEDEHMFAHRSGRFKGLPRPASLLGLLTVAGALALLLLTGCSVSGSDEQTLTVSGRPAAPDPDAIADADADDLEVIEDWSTRLSVGDVEGAAGYFAVPSSTDNGGLIFDIRSDDDAITFNSSLPCGAKVVAAETDGDLTTATFELTDRPGGDCGSGAGGQAATEFKIDDGKIVEWRRVEVPGGGGAAPAGPGAGSPV